MKLPHALSLLFSSAILLSACSTDTPSSDAPSTMPSMPASGTTAPASSGSSAQLNPPHGEPGHVCEIPVGQPLDGSGGTSAPADGQNIQMGGGTDIAPQTMNIPSPSSSDIKLPSGTANPAHGEPGHVCAVSVGDPLP